MATKSTPTEDIGETFQAKYLQWWKFVPIIVLSLLTGLLSAISGSGMFGEITGSGIAMLLVFIISTFIYRGAGLLIKKVYSYPPLMDDRKWMVVCFISTAVAVVSTLVLSGGDEVSSGYTLGTFAFPYLFLGLVVAIGTVAYRGARRGYSYTKSSS